MSGGLYTFASVKQNLYMLKTIIQTTAIALICLTTISCEKEAPIKTHSNSELAAEAESSSLDDFTVILSKAIAKDKDLRDFIKMESLKQFDKDYDVFYPFVKNKRLSSGISFREALLKYTSEDKLEQIEANCPLLNIFVPDWSWINGYSADSWDTNDDFVTVSKKNDGDKHVIYYNGSVYDTLRTDGFPSYPVLIVKNNGRLKVANTKTKSSEATYEFTHEEFDNTNNVQTKANRKWHYDPVPLPVEGCSDFVPGSDIDPLLKNAYEEFADNAPEDACQRDYVYYGMSKSNTTHGVLRNYIRERIYRFKFSPASFNLISDQPEDPTLHETVDVIGRKNSLDAEALYKMIWTEGSFSFQFDIFLGTKEDSSYLSETRIFSVFAKDIFDLSQVQRKYKHQTALERGHYIYYFKSEDLVSKWIYPEGIEFLPEWDISKESDNIHIIVSELDESASYSYTQKVTYEYANNFSGNGDVSGDVSGGASEKKKGIKVGFGVSGGNSSKTTKDITLTYTTTKESDKMGVVSLDYINKILEEPATATINGNNVSGYTVRSIHKGNITITLLPMDVR